MDLSMSKQQMENHQHDILFIIGTPKDNTVPGTEQKVNKYETELEDILEFSGFQLSDFRAEESGIEKYGGDLLKAMQAASG